MHSGFIVCVHSGLCRETQINLQPSMHSELEED